jgi:hypothetical protein
MSDDLIEWLDCPCSSEVCLPRAAKARIEAQAAEIEDLKKSLEIWIFNYQRRDGEKPDKARAYAKAWMFRNANGEEPE